MTEKQIGYEEIGIDDATSPILGINEELAKRDAGLDMLIEEVEQGKLNDTEYHIKKRDIVLEYHKRIQLAIEAKKADIKANPNKYRNL